jgi:DNA primase
MDVIALSQAGFRGAVAPLGTALTEEHLEEIWRLSPEPMVCFDGDAAGQRAALKTAELALTQLSPEKSLKFLSLPAKDDPDSLIKRGGRAAFEAELAKAQPLSAVLFGMLKLGQDVSTPEGRARFWQRLAAAANSIPNKILSTEYYNLLKNQYSSNDKSGRAKPGRSQWVKNSQGRFVPAPPPVPIPPRTPPDPEAAQLRRARLMLAVLLAFPVMISQVEEPFSRVRLSQADEEVRAALQDFVSTGKPLDTDSLVTHLRSLGVDDQVREVQALAKLELRLLEKASLAEAQDAWWEFYGSMDFSRSDLKAQCDEAHSRWLANPTDQAANDMFVRYVRLLETARSGAVGLEEI